MRHRSLVKSLEAACWVICITGATTRMLQVRTLGESAANEFVNLHLILVMSSILGALEFTANRLSHNRVGFFPFVSSSIAAGRDFIANEARQIEWRLQRGMMSS